MTFNLLGGGARKEDAKREMACEAQRGERENKKLGKVQKGATGIIKAEKHLPYKERQRRL